MQQRQFIRSRDWYAGVDPPEERAVTCENCKTKRDTLMTLAPCPHGHAHVSCFACYRAMLDLAFAGGGLKALSWLN